MDRRTFLRHGLALLAAGAVSGPRFALAAGMRTAPERRFVFVILRGALDGLAAVAPIGDPAYAALRGKHDEAELRPLDDFFALHPKLEFVHGVWQARELTIVHAVATGYRDRSHFDAQQVLESGGERAFELRTGWLNRALQLDGVRAMALSTAVPLTLRGDVPVDSWAPSTLTDPDPDLLERIGRMYQEDPQLGPALVRARALHNGAGMADRETVAPQQYFLELAKAAGAFLTAPAGPRIAVMELSGWDTHTQQVARLAKQLELLDRGLAGLRDALGEAWRQTVVLVATEFGRTVRFNGSHGTDHGTATVAFVLGGAVSGGRVLTDWPGLGDSQLWQGRDLRPTIDLRAVQKGILRDHLGLTNAALDREIFPGSSRIPAVTVLSRS
ncbi:Uncharacterized conserved protein, DUF1501 family [Fontimonas thermophila]|uniref:Uncharacterized conserved protein, DUF1501 family n=1 Tax=Fontimonas thermophila TaxID=1076937 RepID=A0A1I2IDZ2_9GAMM|nr:DUF1501 domain-containing protein [Fontimonas thermophila]SFF40612.1 Uncharacterized conserved protein, DUF1501 family [Fontimonas thermophila]